MGVPTVFAAWRPTRMARGLRLLALGGQLAAQVALTRLSRAVPRRKGRASPPLAALPAPAQPLLLVVSQADAAAPFGPYLAEILRGEGLGLFQEVELGTLLRHPDPHRYLAAFPLVLLAASLPPAARRLFRAYVAAGGTLVAIRPDHRLADLFGLRFVASHPERPGQAVAVAPAQAARLGVMSLPLQYHGPSDRYALAGAAALAHLWADLATPTLDPAITLHAYGRGRAVAVTFDLPGSVVLTRQGNPAWQDSEGDGAPRYRAADLFARQSGESWVAPERLRIPQADEVQRLLAGVILSLAPAPLPHLWYLPAGQSVVLVTTADAEYQAGAALEPLTAAVASYGGRLTTYLMDVGIRDTSLATAAAWRAAGHDLGPHIVPAGMEAYQAVAAAWARLRARLPRPGRAPVPPGCGDAPGYSGGIVKRAALLLALGASRAALRRRFGHRARTSRNHCIEWLGWTGMAELEAAVGIELDTNYYHYAPWLVRHGKDAHGYLTGSGLPQRFCTAAGTVLPVYQAATHWPDEWFDDFGFSLAEATAAVTEMIAAAQESYPSVFVANIHHDRYTAGDGHLTRAWAHRLWDAVRARGIPLWSAEQLLDFVLARDRARFEEIAWDGERLSFVLHAPLPGQDLTVLVPVAWHGRVLAALHVDGGERDVVAHELRGRSYAAVTTRAARVVVEARYAAAQIATAGTARSATASAGGGLNPAHRSR
jgi:hypothetical protein